MTRQSSSFAWLGLAVLLAAGACRPSEATNAETLRLYTDEFLIRVTSDPSPPRALEHVAYTVVVLDKDTRQPIDDGAGRIFATNEDRKTTANGFEKGAEPGTYRTKIFFATAGQWAMGLQFRRDSTQRLQRTHDWMQQVLAATPPGQ